MSHTPNRRTVLKLASTATAASLLSRTASAVAAQPAVANDGFVDVTRLPDAVSVVADGRLTSATKSGADRWDANGVQVALAPSSDALSVSLASAKLPVKQIRLRWNGNTSAWTAVLGDHWERAYGDLGWRTPDSFRVAPWYLLVATAAGTHGIGVRTQPSAFCHWTHDADGVTLTCDVRSGGVPVELGDRVLHVCDVVSRKGNAGESAFAAQVAFCRRMSPSPRKLDHTVYGFNDWYYAYGKNTPAGLLADAELLAELVGDTPNRPYCVIDDGWQVKTKVPEGQWSATRPTFGSMAELAGKMKGHNVRTGIWMRPLIDEVRAWPEPWHMSRDGTYLDPTRPEVLNVIATDIKRLRGWGYDLIKHDFSTWDITGRWGSGMHDGEVTADGWGFASRTHTTAEVIAKMYQTIRDAAGDGVVIGCDTVSHLTAGMFELNRIGDDTSGREWHRNPQMGVNALAFRGAQQGSFYGADADCAPVTAKIEWRRLKQWLDLASRSGTPLFVSVERAALNDETRAAISAALRRAAAPQPLAEPLDWATARSPREWNLGGEKVTYDWA